MIWRETEHTFNFQNVKNEVMLSKRQAWFLILDKNM